MAKKRLYTLMFGLACTLLAFATPYCDIRKFSILDGLAANNISDIQQSSDNLMWFGTWNGLSYYDGYSFKTFRDGPHGDDILSTNRIKFLRPTTKNDIWIVTFDNKPYVYDTHICDFVNVCDQLNQEHNIDLRVNDIYCLKNGVTWLTTKEGKYAFRFSTDKNGNVTHELINAGTNGFKGGEIWFIRDDKKGREWVLSQKGTYIYGSKFSTPIPFKWIRQVGNDYYLATVDGKLAIYDSKNKFSMIPLPAGVTKINELKNTGYQLLIATNIGVIIYNTRNFKTKIVSVQSPNQPVAEVKKIYTDYTNLIWVFTEGQGVTTINPNTFETKWLYADQPVRSDRTESDRLFIMQDEHNTLWVVPNHKPEPKQMEEPTENVELDKKKQEEEDNNAFMAAQINDRTTEKIMKFITEHIADPDMKIDDIAQAMGMSRSVLYGKIKNAIGMTPVDFVRHIRIMRATEMLQQTDETLTSIAYAVGFSDPKYFSKVFKKEMGIIPSEYRDRTKQ